MGEVASPIRNRGSTAYPRWSLKHIAPLESGIGIPSYTKQAVGGVPSESRRETLHVIPAINGNILVTSCPAQLR